MTWCPQGEHSGRHCQWPYFSTGKKLQNPTTTKNPIEKGYCVVRLTDERKLGGMTDTTVDRLNMQIILLAFYCYTVGINVNKAKFNVYKCQVLNLLQK